MTTTTTEPIPPVPLPFVSRLTVEPVSRRKVITSEWLKLVTLRSSWITMTLGIGALTLLGGVIGFFLNRDWDRMRPARQAAFYAVGTSLGGARFTELAIGVLGVLFVTGEYGTGMIHSTLTAVPKRLPVLWAKLIVFGALTLFVAEIASFAGFFIGQSTLGSHSVSLSSDGGVRPVVGTGLYLTVVALIGIELASSSDPPQAALPRSSRSCWSCPAWYRSCRRPGRTPFRPTCPVSQAPRCTTSDRNRAA